MLLQLLPRFEGEEHQAGRPDVREDLNIGLLLSKMGKGTQAATLVTATPNVFGVDYQ